MKLLAMMIAFITLFSFPLVVPKDDNYDLIIITPPIFLNELQKFVEFKENNGIKAMVAIIQRK
ncbi:MAG: hypothetical protein J7J36_00775 [Thermoplasmata archaeon]|nr:hypothetical protein [Thermoplasmata archaeon]